MTEQPSTTASSAADRAARPAGRRSRRTIASFSTYAEAERLVDRLAELGFPVDRASVVGQDLELVEQPAGKLDVVQAAARGALCGAVPGALVGWIFGLLSFLNPLVTSVLLALYGLVFGALVGAVVGLVVYALVRGRRDSAPVTTMLAHRFDVLVDEAVADEAVRLLGRAV
ncbi:MAG: hypothetical protein QOG20_1807 [Pseudonocardiales bacterium]|jgi:uncharacterized membrane protein|nr:hypothetical protein [Pseudonocardiales bacterium]